MLLILQADARHLPLADQSVQMCVTSPPYWSLRDYGAGGQLGLEATPEAYVAEIVAAMREVRRVLRDDGTLWLNLGDSYATGMISSGLKPKNLVGIPWRVAFALQADGWWLRSDIIWAKPNPMPEGVTDRPTVAHEYLFLLTKSARYYYDAAAIAEPMAEATYARLAQATFDRQQGGPKDYGPDSNRSARRALVNARRALVNLKGRPQAPQIEDAPERYNGTRNRRSVWTVATQPYPGAHFATFPPKLIEPCILAGSRPGDVVLDPFAGSGTTGRVALQHGRRAVLCDLNADYLRDQARQRVQTTIGLGL